MTVPRFIQMAMGRDTLVLARTVRAYREAGEFKLACSIWLTGVVLINLPGPLLL